MPVADGGDGTVDAGEQCDGGNLNGSSGAVFVLGLGERGVHQVSHIVSHSAYPEARESLDERSHNVV